MFHDAYNRINATKRQVSSIIQGKRQSFAECRHPIPMTPPPHDDPCGRHGGVRAIVAS